MNKRILKMNIGKTTYVVAARFKVDGRTTAKGKLLRLMERDLQQNLSQKIGQTEKGVANYE